MGLAIWTPRNGIKGSRNAPGLHHLPATALESTVHHNGEPIEHDLSGFWPKNQAAHASKKLEIGQKACQKLTKTIPNPQQHHVNRLLKADFNIGPRPHPRGVGRAHRQHRPRHRVRVAGGGKELQPKVSAQEHRQGRHSHQQQRQQTAHLGGEARRAGPAGAQLVAHLPMADGGWGLWGPFRSGVSRSLGDAPLFSWRFGVGSSCFHRFWVSSNGLKG